MEVVGRKTQVGSKIRNGDFSIELTALACVFFFSSFRFQRVTTLINEGEKNNRDIGQKAHWL